MARPVTLFTGQWADMPIKELCQKSADFGYDGLELACWGDHLDVDKAAEDKEYAQGRHEMLAEYGLKCWVISNHLAGQLVCDPNDDERTDAFAPEQYSGDAEAKRDWAVESMKNTARAAQNMGVDTVAGFTGSPIWHLIYSFPPLTPEKIEKGFERFAELWKPILDVFSECGVKFGLEVHPTEIAFDIITARRVLEAVDYHEAYGFNFDPSHLQWQGIDSCKFLEDFADRIVHVHMKDAAVTLDGRSSILASYLNFGQPGRGWDFRSVGRGDVDFEEIIRTLNNIGYHGPLSVEWEDAMMEREAGAAEACEFVKNVDFEPSSHVFDEAFGE